MRQIAKEVPLSDIGTPKLDKIIEEMKKALDSQMDGVAIAAPQIGEPLRIFVVSGKINKILEKDAMLKIAGVKNKSQLSEADRKILAEKKYPDQVYINPKIKKISKDSEWLEEGCLSIRYAYGKRKRAKKATIEAYDENGKRFTRGGSGLLAQIFQHETDHLEGELFIDKAKDLREIPPEEWREMQTE